MTDTNPTQISPISQVLQSLGLTRQDLHRHSDQMRQFLTAEHANSLRVLAQDAGSTNALPSISASSSSIARSLSRSRDASASSQTPPPSATPVKSEPDESVPPLRHFDSMEMVIERKSRQNRKDRKGRKARNNMLSAAHHSPSPSRVSPASYPGFSLDAFMQSRDIRRVSVSEASDSNPSTTLQMQELPITPQRGNYYRDHSTNEASTSRRRQNLLSSVPHSPTPTRSRRKVTTIIPVTPKGPRGRVSPFPSSSPPPPSSPSPFSSPTKPIINTVSSPGPMPPLPLEEDYDELPYTLPPGPYSSKKPDLSYAALVGQAILSSPMHRLTLQEIYDWITIVYPHFQREETTWMNSIRHVLSTTACFRKVVRERAIGRTLWAIWDEDLPCFEGGVFKKHLCKDMEDRRTKSGSGGRARKRNGSDLNDEDGEPGATRKTKRPKKEKTLQKETGHPSQIPHPYALPYLLPAAQHSLPLFPPTRPTPHHQPYYTSCIPPVHIPSEMIFPPLPPGLGYGYHNSGAIIYGGGYNSASGTSDITSQTPSTFTPPDETPSSCIPALTPNRISSPGSPLLVSEASTSSQISGDICKIKASVPVESESDFDDEHVLKLEDDGVFDIGDSLQPGIMLLDKMVEEREKDSKVKGRRKIEKGVTKKTLVLPPMPTSPSLNRRSRATKNGKIAHVQLPPIHRPSTPPAGTPAPDPCTPPPRDHDPKAMATPPRNRNISHIHVSSMCTPRMTPSPSRVHYKAHLDPTVSFANNTLNVTDDGEPDSENALLPSHKRNTESSAIFPPATPKRLVFLSNTDSSPFRTPLGRSLTSAASPFRTPGSRGIFDPHDPGALLDEELSRLGAVGQFGFDSPTGLFGKGGEGLLYESPNVPSPGRWTKLW